MSENIEMTGPAMKIAGAVRAANRWVALACGTVLLLAVVLILCEVLGRRIPFFRVGGADELSGYVMAAIATWGFSYALVERAHVRIDLLHAKLPAPGRAFLDALAMASVLFVALVVTYYAYDVFAKSVARGSRSNTTLAIPLWMPQVIWLAGWLWLTLTSALMLASTVLLALSRRWRDIDAVSGIETGVGETA